MSRRAAAWALLAALALTGCGLPLSDGVQVPRAVDDDEAQPLPVEVLPPGPRRDMEPSEVVRGFLTAQRNDDDGHAIARQYLAPEAQPTWDDGAGVTVYDAQLSLTPTVDAGSATVVAAGAITASLADDGSFNPADGTLTETYRLRNDPDLGWRLTEVPPGLRLRGDKVLDSFVPREIHYLARASEGDQQHLVPDRAFLPRSDDPVPGLVRRLLAGPSDALRPAADTAVPPGSVLRSVTTDGAGVVTVDLDVPDGVPKPQLLRRLSAQLVWTLRGAGSSFVELRLLVDGRPAPVEGAPEGDTQPRSAWAEFDPDGLTDRAPGYYVDRDRQVSAVDGDPPAGAVDRTADLAAVSPRGGQLALLADVGGGWEVRTGPTSGTLPARPDLTAPTLSSPSWGSGGAGLWLLAGERVLLLDGVAREVQVDPPQLTRLGRITVLRVSRDGARVALVAGDSPATQRVFVGTVARPTAGDLRITGLRLVGDGVTGVTDVAWESGTQLVAVGRPPGPGGPLEPLPVRLAVDGSGPVELIRLPGLGQRVPLSIAAAPGRPLLVGAEGPDGPVVLREEVGLLTSPTGGEAPFYPG